MTLSLEMKFLDEGSLAELLELQNIIAADLPIPEIFMLHDERYFRETLCQEHSAIGAIAGEGLIAFSIIRIPGLSCENLGRDISMPEEELAKVAHLQAAAVHPAYRGLGLQRKLTFAHLDVIRGMGYEHACCTVSPKNPVSLSNYLSCGLAIEGLRPKKYGWLRFILHKKIRQANHFPQSSHIDRKEAVNRDEPGADKEKKRISISDIAGQLDLLGKGFRGFRVSSHCEGAQVFYAKF